MGLLKELSDIANGKISEPDTESFGKLIAENDQWRLWKNEMTEYYEKELEQYDESGFTLKGELMIVLAENKLDGYRTYLALDRITQKPFADWTRPEEFDLKKRLILIDRKDECNIINMAETMQNGKGKKNGKKRKTKKAE